MREAFPSSGSALAEHGWKHWRNLRLFRNTVFYLSGRFGSNLRAIGAPSCQQVLPAGLLSIGFLQEMCGKAEDNAGIGIDGFISKLAPTASPGQRYGLAYSG